MAIPIMKTTAPLLTRRLAAAVPDPALNGRWYANLSSIASMFNNLNRDKSSQFPLPWYGNINFEQQIGRVNIETFSEVFTQTPAESRPYGGKSLHFPGWGDMPNLSITFYETHDHLIKTILEAWKKLVFNYQTGDYGVPAQYMGSITLFQYKANTVTEIAYQRTYFRVFPTDITAAGLSYSEPDGRLTVEAEFSCDYYVKSENK